MATCKGEPKAINYQQLEQVLAVMQHPSSDPAVMADQNAKQAVVMSLRNNPQP